MKPEKKIRKSNLLSKTNLSVLLNKSYGPLSKLEQSLAQKVEAGEDLDAAIEPENNKIIRGSILRWLCADTEAAKLVHAKGLRLKGAEVSGDIDLESIIGKFPIVFEKCHFNGKIVLNHASFPYIKFIESDINEFSAINLRLQGSLVLNRSKINNGALLTSTQIGGNLRLAGACIKNAGKTALDLNGASIGNLLDLGGKFFCHGAIRIYGARISGNIECSGLIFSPRTSAALTIESSNIGGSVLLRNGFRCLGQVRLYQTSIGGSLEMQGARLCSRNAALYVEHSKISNSIILGITNDPRITKRIFHCLGGMHIRRTQISGRVDVAHSQVRSKRRMAVDFTDSKIDGRLIGSHVEIYGEFSLDRSTVGNDIVFTNASLNHSNKNSLSGIGLRCGGSLFLDNGFHAEGIVNLKSIDIGDELYAANSNFNNNNKTALFLSDSRIRSMLNLSNSIIHGNIEGENLTIGSHAQASEASISGSIILSRSQIGGHLILKGATCSNPTGEAIRADGFRCVGSINLQDFKSNGLLNFYNATVGTVVFADRASFTTTSENTFLFEGARISGDLILVNSSFDGSINLRRSSIGGTLYLSKSILHSNGSKCALNAQGCAIAGDILLNDGFLAFGMINVARSRIGGNFYIMSCKILNRNKISISIMGSHIQGDLIASSYENNAVGHWETRCLGRFDASKSTIEGNADLTGAWLMHRNGTSLYAKQMKVKGSLLLDGYFEATGKVDLQHAAIGNLVDQEISWSRHRELQLQGLTYFSIYPFDARMRLRWLHHGKATDANERNGTSDFYPQPHEQLSQTLKRMGHEREARKIAIDKQKNIGKGHGRSGLSRVAHSIYGTTMRYGYRPQQAALFAPIFIFGLAVALSLGARDFMYPTAKDARDTWETTDRRLPSGYPEFNSLAYSIDTFVPILNLQQKDSWRPGDIANKETGNVCRSSFWLRIYLWLHTAFGWIITTLAVAGFTGLVRKD